MLLALLRVRKPLATTMGASVGSDMGARSQSPGPARDRLARGRTDIVPAESIRDSLKDGYEGTSLRIADLVQNGHTSSP